MFRRILVPLTGQDVDRAALQAAFGIARDFDSHVVGMLVRRDPRDALPLVGEGLSATLLDEMMRSAETEAETQARAAGSAFDAARRAAGAVLVERPPGPGGPTASWQEVTGRNEETIAVEGRLSDLVVLAHAARETGAGFMPAVESALLGSARPLLLAPSPVPSRIGEAPAIAWNGSAEAARAVAAAMPLLRRADVVHVLTADPVMPKDAGSRLAGYLAWHGITAQVSRLRSGEGPVGELLIQKATALQADLLVMGGYGHSRIREMILGGVTRYVLNHSGLPVLMAH